MSRKFGKAAGIVFALLILFWELAARAVNRPFLPQPLAVFRAFFRLSQTGILVRHLGASLFRLFWALVTGFFPAAALGLAAGRSVRLNTLISPFIYIIHPLPKAAFLPIIMLFLGLGNASKIFLLAFIIFSQVLLTARDAASRTPEESVIAVRSMGASGFDLFRHVILPAALPGLCTGLRVSLGTAVAVLFLAETFATDTGLGYLILDAWTRVSYAEMFAAIFALSLLGLALFALIDVIEHFICPWER